jgi:DNA-binding NarL/FixJ family response regulator
METTKTPAQLHHVQVGGPLGVLLVIDSPPLLMRMGEVVRSLQGLRLAGSFTGVAQAVDWLAWHHASWQFAFIDLALGETGEDLVQRLLSQSRPGNVVALGDHLWHEVREKCSEMGVYDLLEKGDVAAFRSFLEARVH